jgi:hypothetical protein
MTWIPLLLTDPSPCLRYLVLREILQLPDDHPEVHELEKQRYHDPLITNLTQLQTADGSWTKVNLTQTGHGGPIYATSMALYRLGFLGFNKDDEFIKIAANFLFTHQLSDGSWPLLHTVDESEPDEGYSMIPLQTAFPLRGLAACGFSQDPCCERAYDWLITHQLPDGAWPTGIASGNYGYVGGYRRLAHSRWGCRSNTTAVVSCFCFHPMRRNSDENRRGLDLLLGRETQEARQVGFEVARLLGAEPVRGFISHFARFDPGLMLSFCSKASISDEDPRVKELIKFIVGLQGDYGLWEYPAHPQMSRWVSFDLYRSLNKLVGGDGWIGLEPQTPFTPYPKRKRRF